MPKKEQEIIEKHPVEEPLLELPLTVKDYTFRHREIPSHARFAFQRKMEEKYPKETKLRSEWDELFKAWASAKPE